MEVALTVGILLDVIILQFFQQKNMNIWNGDLRATQIGDEIFISYVVLSDYVKSYPKVFLL